MFKPTPTLLCDFYKISHRKQYPEGTTMVYSNLTPRSGKYYKGKSSKVLFFGLKYFIKHVLVDLFNERFFNRDKAEVVSEYARVIKHCLGDNNPDTSHIEQLHDLGYLPLHIKALPELSLVDYQVPVLTVRNTHPDFYWLTNFIETVMSSDLWLMSNNATLAYDYKIICEEWASKTCDNSDHVPFQCHDFSFRGMGGHEAATMSGMAHLTQFKGTDTIPAIQAMEYYYGKNIETELIGTSIPASEHAVMCAGGKESEFETYKRFITELYPNGFVSIVSDTWDFFGVLTNILPKLKSEIMSRDGKTVIRPDSGNPVDIICGEYIPTFTCMDNAKEYCINELYHYQKRFDTTIYDLPTSGDYICRVENKSYSIKITGEYKCNDEDYIFEIIEIELKPEQQGAIELLWDTFGGTINSKGYKVLDSHIGLIYGDSITHERAQQIFERLESKGFASSNVVFGVGSFSYQYNTRDSQGWAVKATYCEVNGEGRAIFKQPKTDAGKKSAKGLLRVDKSESGYVLTDNCTWGQESGGELQTVFLDGK